MGKRINMKQDSKSEQKLEKANSTDRKIRVIGVEKEADVPKRGSWLFRAVVPLVAGIVLNCGGPNSYEEDVDSTDGDVAAEVEEDVPDADVLDVPDTEDASPEIEEDVGPDEASDVLDVEDLPDLTDELEEDVGLDEASDVEEDGEAETDTYDCTETSGTEETPTVLPEPACGSTQTVTDVDYVVEWVGADCESTSRTSTRTGRVLTLSPDVDISGLNCIRAKTTSTPQGDELLVAATETSLETATAIVCADMTVGTNLDGGDGEYKFRLTDVRDGEATGTIFNSDWGMPRNTRVYGTGVTSISSTRGWIAAEFNPGAAAARICYIELPTRVRNNGDTETWAGYGDFTFNTIISGARMQGWEWAL